MISVSGDPPLVTDSDVHALTWEFVNSGYRGDEYANWPIERRLDGAVNLDGAQRDRGVQGLGGLGVGGMGQAPAVSPVTSFQTANRRVISVR
jgi:hypothetical protein